MPDFKLKDQLYTYINLIISTLGLHLTSDGPNINFGATAHNSWHAIYAQLTGGNTTRGFTFAFETYSIN